MSLEVSSDSTPAGVNDEPTLESLLRQMQQGSERAAWLIVERYGPHILRSVRRLMDRRLRRRLDSQDFVQAIWASFFARPQKVLAMQRPEELIAYLTRITRNAVIDGARRHKLARKRAIGREFSLDESAVARTVRRHAAQTPRPSQIAMAREEWELLSRNQPSHYRKIVYLRLSGQTHQAIADELGLSERTVRRVLDQLLKRRPPDAGRSTNQEA